MSYTKTRVIQSAGYNGKWVVQGWWPDNQVWADIGDACDSYEDATTKQRQVEEDSD